MKNAFIFFLTLFFLVGCQVAQNTKLYSLEDINFSDSGVVIHTPIPTIGSLEIYRDDSLFNLLQDDPRCRIGGGLLEDSLYCEGLSGYNHLYKSNSLKYEYLYESVRLSPSNNPGKNNFFSETGGVNYAKDNVLMLTKNPNDSPLSIVKSHLGKGGCEIATGWLGAGYDSYGVWMFRDFNLDDYKNISNRCIPDLPIDHGNDSWLYVFSPQHLDYYYIIGMNMIAGSGPQIYTDKSLKLFVE